MFKLLVWTSKGGSGKTTTVANIGPELARLGLDVLMVGFDPQGDLESTFGVDDDDVGVVRVESLLDGRTDPRGAAVDVALDGVRGWRRARRGGRLRLLASSPALRAAMGGVAVGGYDALARVLDAFVDEVDVVVIDTQGALTPLSHAAVRAADGVLFTLEPGYYEYRSLVTRLAELDELRAQGAAAMATVGVMFVRTSSRSRQMREYRAHLEGPDLGGEPVHVFATHTRQQASVRDHPRLAQPTVLADPGGHVADDYRRFVAELVERIPTPAAAR